jgi:histidine triad (HIT) family protein
MMGTMSGEAASCVFCRILRGELTPGVLAFCDGHTAVFPSLHQRPRNRGHMLVVPIRHVAHIYEIDGELAGPLMTTLARVAAAVKTVCCADGISIRQNNERHGDQDVLHVHFHVIPRLAGDEFSTGDDRYPLSAVEVALEERVEQASKLAEVLQGKSET